MDVRLSLKISRQEFKESENAEGSLEKDNYNLLSRRNALTETWGGGSVRRGHVPVRELGLSSSKPKLTRGQWVLRKRVYLLEQGHNKAARFSLRI